MDDNISDIRRRRVRQLIDQQFSGVLARFANRIGRSANQAARWFMDSPEHRRNIGERLARDIERQLHLPRLWLDSDDGGLAPTRSDVVDPESWQLGHKRLDELIVLTAAWLTQDQLAEIDRDFADVARRTIRYALENMQRPGNVRPDEIGKSAREQTAHFLRLLTKIIETGGESALVGALAAIKQSDMDKAAEEVAAKMRDQGPS